MGISGVFNKKAFKASGLGALAAMFIMLICICVSAAFISNEIIAPNASSVITIVIQVLASFVGAVVAANINPINKYLCTILAALIYLFLLIILSVILFQGVAGGIVQVIISIAVGSVCSLLLTKKNANRGKKRRRSRK